MREAEACARWWRANRPDARFLFDDELRAALEHIKAASHVGGPMDGGDGLFFLRGTPPASHQRKQFCRIAPDVSIAPVMKWDNQGEHLMSGTACWASGSSLVRSYRVYNPTPGAGPRFIERVDLGSADRPRWKVPIEQPAAALVSAAGSVLYSLMNGTVAGLDLESGKKQWETKLEIDGVSTIATALAVGSAAVAVGTIDGRVLLYELDRGARNHRG